MKRQVIESIKNDVATPPEEKIIMANLPVCREIEVKVNMDQLACEQVLLELDHDRLLADTFNRYTYGEKVSVNYINPIMDGLFTLEEKVDPIDGEKYMEYAEYIEGSLGKQDCVLKVRVSLNVKAKKYESLVDDYMSRFKVYVENTLVSYANIRYFNAQIRA